MTNNKDKLTKAAQISTFNLGFGLFMFFLYKFCIFSLIQLKYLMGSIGELDAMVLCCLGVMLLGFTLLLLFRFQLF